MQLPTAGHRHVCGALQLSLAMQRRIAFRDWSLRSEEPSWAEEMWLCDPATRKSLPPLLPIYLATMITFITIIITFRGASRTLDRLTLCLGIRLLRHTAHAVLGIPVMPPADLQGPSCPARPCCQGTEHGCQDSNSPRVQAICCRHSTCCATACGRI